MPGADGCSSTTLLRVLSIPLVIGCCILMGMSAMRLNGHLYMPRKYDNIVNIFHYIVCTIGPFLIFPSFFYMMIRCQGQDSSRMWIIITIVMGLSLLSSANELLNKAMKGPTWATDE